MSKVLKSGFTLATIAAVCTTFVAATWHATAARIAANEQAYLEQSLAPAVAGIEYDSGLLDSKLLIPEPHTLPGAGDAIVYRVYREGEPAAALFVVSARDGYSGPIRLLVGVGIDGSVAGIHVLEHRETPGLGDGIETAKSDWALQFAGKSLANPLASGGGWAIRSDGGEFDQLTGASVTPRAVIKAIRQTLIYFDANRDTVFAKEPQE